MWNVSKSVHVGSKSVNKLSTKGPVFQGHKHWLPRCLRQIRRTVLSSQLIDTWNQSFLHCHIHLAQSMILISIPAHIFDFGSGNLWKKETKCKWAVLSMALIVKWLTFPPQIRAGFSAPLVEMLIVLSTQFNVNPILLFCLLGRSSLSLFPYAAAGGTGSRLTPPSGSGESAQERKRRRNRRRVEEDPSCTLWECFSWGVGGSADFKTMNLLLQNSTSF